MGKNRSPGIFHNHFTTTGCTIISMRTIRGFFSSRWFAFVVLVVATCMIAGCSQPGTGGPAGVAKGPGGCDSAASCAAYCQQHTTECDQFCSANPSACGGAMGSAPAAQSEGKGDFSAGTSCDTPAIKQKFSDQVNRILVSPPASLRAPNWQTKILPAGNPYPGYYYDISTAFGPAIDAQTTGWSGTGEPPRTPGLDYYIIGYWEEIPKGRGGNLGEQSADSVDFSKYQLAVFYTNVSGPSQAAMIDALPDLTISESDAKAFFASKIKKSFISLDDKQLTRSGNGKMYEVIWHDSDNTQDYWDVQIGIGYIAIGQGKVYSAESQLKGDPGTRWKYHACKPCENCDTWGVEKAFNKDCTKASDCLGGLSCSGGYCVDPKSAGSQPSTAAPATTGGSSPSGAGGPGNTGAPGASCSGITDCASGLTCKGGICAIPGGP